MTTPCRTLRTVVVTFFHVPMTAADQSGVQLRFSAILRALHQISREITLVHVVPEEQVRHAGDLDELSHDQSRFWGVPLEVVPVARRTRRRTSWTQYGAGILDAWAQPSLHPFGGPEVVRVLAAQLAQGTDLVFAHGMPAMVSLLQANQRLPAVVYDIDDIPHVVRLRTAISPPRYLGKFLTPLQVPALVALERRAVATARLSLVCSEADRRYLARLRYPGRIEAVPNAVRLPPDPPGLVAERSVLFLGDCTYPPNRAAAERMAQRIWPFVRARVPDGRLLIAGKGSDHLPCAGAGLPGVAHLGFVDDLGALYARSRVVCCPIMTGGGTRLKLVEGAAYARPMVSTRIGAEGLDFRDGEEILLRDADAEFAEACASLLGDDAQCRALGEAARVRMAALYDRKAVEDRLANLIEWAVVEAAT